MQTCRSGSTTAKPCLHSHNFSACVLLPAHRLLQQPGWRPLTKMRRGCEEPLRCAPISCRRSNGCGHDGPPIRPASWQTASDWARQPLSSPFCSCSGDSTAAASYTVRDSCIPCTTAHAGTLSNVHNSTDFDMCAHESVVLRPRTFPMKFCFDMEIRVSTCVCHLLRQIVGLLHVVMLRKYVDRWHSCRMTYSIRNDVFSSRRRAK